MRIIKIVMVIFGFILGSTYTQAEEVKIPVKLTGEIENFGIGETIAEFYSIVTESNEEFSTDLSKVDNIIWNAHAPDESGYYEIDAPYIEQIQTKLALLQVHYRFEAKNTPPELFSSNYLDTSLKFTDGEGLKPLPYPVGLGCTSDVSKEFIEADCNYLVFGKYRFSGFELKIRGKHNVDGGIVDYRPSFSSSPAFIHVWSIESGTEMIKYYPSK